MKKYIIYARVASRKQTDKNSSITSQVETLKTLANTIDVEVTDIITELSSTIQDRKEFNQMIEKLGNGKADGILCMSLGRLCRTSVDIEKVIHVMGKKGIQVITPGEVYNKDTDKLFLMSVIFAMEEYSRAMHSHRIKLGRDKRRGK